MFGLSSVIAKKSSIELVVFINLYISWRVGGFLQIVDIEIFVYDSLGDTWVSAIWERLDLDLISSSRFQVVLTGLVILACQSILESMELLCLRTFFNLSWG